jgi:hemerythrin
LLVQEWFLKLSNMIDILAECGAATAALEMEHDAAEIILGALKEAVHAGAETMLILRIMDEATEFFSLLFPHQESLLCEHCDPEIEPHAAAHHELMTRFTMARAAVENGYAEAMLDAVDILQSLHGHVDTWDKPAFERLLRRASDNGNCTPYEEIQLVRFKNRSGLTHTVSTACFNT